MRNTGPTPTLAPPGLAWAHLWIYNAIWAQILKGPSLEVTSTESTSLMFGLMAHTCPSLGTDLKAWTLGSFPVHVLQSLQTAEGVFSHEYLPSLFNQRNSLETKPSKISTSQPGLGLPWLSYHLRWGLRDF